ncbi:AraC family transcriptional regulator [Streptococcus mutans]|nr:AraC family transcriptional regulator [Streptococcus mutans]
MTIIKSFNDVIHYLETVFDDEKDEKKVTQLSGYSYALFSRLFFILTKTIFSEYLRSRRLTEAAIILRDTDEKIIDVAFKFGYESSDSFGTAFKNFYGFTPSEIRSGKPFRLVSRVQLALSVKGKSIGVCHDVESPSAINYMAGYIVTDVNKTKSLGLGVLNIEEAEYAIVELTRSVPECIHNGWKYAMEVFFPEHGYVHSGKPDFEYYYEGDMDSKDYKMGLWIPICKA